MTMCLNKYEGIVARLSVRNAILKENAKQQLMLPPPTPRRHAMAPAVVALPPAAYATAYPSLPAPLAAPVPAPRKPRETWSAVVVSKDPNMSGKEVAERVRKEIAPSLGVRLHEVRGLARGGAIIRTPSSGEIRKVVANKRFGEIGLEVKPSPAQRPKVVVSNVDTATIPDDFMHELYKNNFAEHMTLAAFSKAVHLENTWSVTDGPTVNVTLNVDPTALDVLDGGKAYIGWFAYNCRALANCGRGRAATIEVGVRLRESGHLFALLHEPYLGDERMDLLPEGMRLFADRRGKPAIVVNYQDVICMLVDPLTTDFGVCLSIKGNFGSIFLCSAYCQFDTELEPYLRYMDAVLLQASRTPAILGLDANAVSPMWFSKLSRHAEGRANYNRGELLSEWMLEKGAVALNQPSEVFTFDNLRAHSDIDVTIVNDAASMWATYDCRVDVWELSDHNMITVVATPT
ncbi:hypothetical protein KR009_009222, partial [Drosophila setifemur]